MVKQCTQMTFKQRVALCEHKRDHPKLTQNDLVRWLEASQGIKVSQATVSSTLKRTDEFLSRHFDTKLGAKWKKAVKYSDMEHALVEWFHAYQDKLNITGDLLKEKGAFFLEQLHPRHPPFFFSNGWLERFKSCHGIKSFRRFGESGSVDEAVIDHARPSLQQTLDQFE